MRMTAYAWSSITGVVVRVATLAGLWWLIAQGRPDAWLVGLPTVAIAALVSVRLGGAALPRLSLAGVPRFVALFLRESLAGGLDVARRTLGAKLRIQPGFRRYRMRLDHASARVLFVNCVSLLPGTLAVELDGDDLEMHLLDASEDPQPQLLQLEQAIAGLFPARTESGHV
jgi:multicomponent Na+:H+ antiporter subunit E